MLKYFEEENFMNVYDFDKTIYDGDSTIDFYFYCIKRQPSLLKFLPKQAWAFIKYLFGFFTKTQFKERLFEVFSGIKNIDDYIKDFWANNNYKIKKWYKNTHFDSDIVISASPEFLLEPICSELKIKKLMASRVDKKTGIYTGENCYGAEKVKRFYEIFPKEKIDTFYSDSLSDTPLKEISQNAYIVQKENLIEWDTYKPSLFSKLKNTFLSLQFIMFLIIGVINTINGIGFAYLYSLIIDNVNLAFIVGYFTSLTIAYLLNSFLTFKEHLAFKKFIKFCISYIPNFLIQNLFVILFYNILRWEKLLVYCLDAIIDIPVTFLLLKLFKKKKKKS